jgi:phosphopantothenoylcysteine decarboxylase/phosphopantothenate--cysteine ligase
MEGRRVLLGVTGGIAAYKAAHLARLLSGAGAQLTTVLTDAATRFVGADTFAALTGGAVHTSLWERPGEILHVRLAHEADVALVAPATAHLIAKLAHGLADDLLSSTLLEYRGPLVLAPAMHTGMWEHPATRGNVAILAERGARFVGPVSGALAHGDSGPGRMAEPEDILAAVRAALEEGGPADGSTQLGGRVIVVTAGPTHEPIDPVRFIANRSSGRMGMSLAAAAVARGAEVRLIVGPGTVAPPNGVSLTRVSTAEEMRNAVLREAADADAVIMAAAVADFRPKAASEGKLKKDQGPPELLLEPTPDILAEIGEAGEGARILVGFAAETHDVEAAGRAKLTRKHLDLLVANEVGRGGTGFGSETNHAAILSARGDDVGIRDWTKRELAEAILERVGALLDLRSGSDAADTLA